MRGSAIMPDEGKSSAPPVMPDFSEKLAVKLFGLPRNRLDNFTCTLPVVLAIFLQIRFSGTFMAEGGFAFLGFIGYVLTRLWLTNRRYPEPGQVVIEKSRITIPASLNNGKSEILELSDVTRIRLFVYKGRQGMMPTSITIYRGGFSVRISWLALELNQLVQILETRGCPMERHPWSPVALLAIFILLILLGVASLLLLAR